MFFFHIHIFSSHHFLIYLLTVSIAEELASGSNTSHTELQISHPSEETTRQTHEVQFHYRIAAHQKGHLTCEVMLSTDAKKVIAKSGNRSLSHVYLRCPLVKTGICYVDCTPACSYDEVKGCVVPLSLASAIEDCRFEILPESDKIILDYTIAMEALDRTGEWNCEYQGIAASRALKLQSSPKIPNFTKITTISSTGSAMTTATAITSPTPPTPTPLVIIYQPHHPPIPIRQSKQTSDPTTYAQSSPQTGNEVSGRNVFWGLTKLRPEVILALIALTVIAIFLNVVLSVRCAMTKCYFESLRRGESDHCLGKWLCFESSESSLRWEKGHHHHQESQHYSIMLPPTPPIPPPAFYTPYHQSDQQSESSGLIPSYARHISLTDSAAAKLLASQQQQLQIHQQTTQGTLSTTSSTDVGTPNPFSTSLSGTLPVHYHGKSDNIEIGSMGCDLCNQAKVYLIKVADPNALDQQQNNQLRNSPNNNIYDDELMNSGVRSAFQTVTPTLVRLPGSNEPAELIVCHRLADDGSNLSKTQSEADFAAGGSRILTPSQAHSYVLISPLQSETPSQSTTADISSQ
nr:conserved hypothetical protein [Hymenolepis microstoma]